ncbi:MAG: choice-of-anchor D domain-containing protein [Acidobacteriaceae bacterium]|nr:choice-of-anchor D domain-containing protein [Acidobacteriaceae bacterium]
MSSTTLTFGNQNVGTSGGSQTIVLSNTSDVPLNITNILVSGTNSADFSLANTCPAALISGTSCTATVTFQPSGAGSRSAKLMIEGDSSTSETVLLSGAGGNSTQSSPNPGSNTLSPGPASPFSSVASSSAPLSPASASSVSPSPALRFVPILPCRVVDTRNPDGPLGGPILQGGTVRDFVIPRGQCGMPPTAQAYALNVTVVPTQPLGSLNLWPSGQIQSVSWTLNWGDDGRSKANAAIIPAGTDGAISVFATETTDVLIDTTGYFVPVTVNASGLAFFPLVAPCRVADTRLSLGPLGGPYLPAGTIRSFPLLQSTCNTPSTARAYSLTFTAVPRGSALAYMTVWPAGQPQPVASTLNAPTGMATANAGIIQAGSAGDISVYVPNDSDLVIDINGYFASDAGGLSLYNVAPCRAFTTSLNQGSQLFSGTLEIDLSGQCGTPISAQVYVLNTMVAPEEGLGYLTLWESGQPLPGVSTLNVPDGFITPNLAIVPAANGHINAFTSNPTALTLDLFGYFAQ